MSAPKLEAVKVHVALTALEKLVRVVITEMAAVPKSKALHDALNEACSAILSAPENAERFLEYREKYRLEVAETQDELRASSRMAAEDLALRISSCTTPR